MCKPYHPQLTTSQSDICRTSIWNHKEELVKIFSDTAKISTFDDFNDLNIKTEPKFYSQNTQIESSSSYNSDYEDQIDFSEPQYKSDYFDAY